MPEPTATDDRTLVRRTLVTVAVMVGACVVVVGTLTLVASSIAGHATLLQDASDSGSVAPQNALAPSKTFAMPANAARARPPPSEVPTIAMPNNSPHARGAPTELPTIVMPGNSPRAKRPPTELPQ